VPFALSAAGTRATTRASAGSIDDTGEAAAAGPLTVKDLVLPPLPHPTTLALLSIATIAKHQFLRLDI
jgi:hypothetical protein